jgi:hypothetical protein
MSKCRAHTVEIEEEGRALLSFSGIQQVAEENISKSFYGSSSFVAGFLGTELSSEARNSIKVLQTIVEDDEEGDFESDYEVNTRYVAKKMARALLVRQELMQEKELEGHMSTALSVLDSSMVHSIVSAKMPMSPPKENAENVDDESTTTQPGELSLWPWLLYRAARKLGKLKVQAASLTALMSGIRVGKACAKKGWGCIAHDVFTVPMSQWSSYKTSQPPISTPSHAGNKLKSNKQFLRAALIGCQSCSGIDIQSISIGPLEQGIVIAENEGKPFNQPFLSLLSNF